MFKKIWQLLKKLDWYLTINIFLLMIIGLAALYSLQLNVDNPDFSLFKKQLSFAIVGLIIYLILSIVSYNFWSSWYKFLLLAVALLLILVIFAGVTISGTKGWLNFFGQTFQPVELAKIALVIFLARYFSSHAKDPRLSKTVIISALVTMSLIALVILQPDLGSAVILFGIWLIMIMFLPLKKKFFLMIFVVLIVLLAVSWLFFLKDYQQDRILTFLNPKADPLGSGYNVRQSVVAVGSGGFLGRGLSFGSQSQLNFLPAQETDFIFAVIAEELGFIGAGLMLLLYLSLFWRMYQIIKSQADGFGIFLTLGVAIFFLAQMLINIGMNIGIMPVTGLPLPLVSYGGSSLIASLISLAIVQNIAINNRLRNF